MALPKYADINGPVLTNGNKHYKEYGSSDSSGNPGSYHIYYDGSVQFVATQPNIGGMSGAGNNNSIASGAAAAAAPPPPPPPAAPAAPAPAPAAPTSSAAGNSHQDVYAMTDVSPTHSFGEIEEIAKQRGVSPVHDDNGKKYYVIEHSADSQGHTGVWHIYEDNTKRFISQSDHIELVSDNAASNTATAVATSSTSSPGTNHADGVHNEQTGFTGHASELHTSAPAPDVSTASVTQAAVAQPTNLPDGSVTTNTGSVYTVAEGDNLWDIAQAHNMTVEQLQALNPQIEHPELINPGDQINLGDAPAATEMAGPAFPTTSTYDASTTQVQTAEAHPAGLGGWSDGTSSLPTDPANNSVAGVAAVQTDPLKIHDDNQNS